VESGKERLGNIGVEGSVAGLGPGIRRLGPRAFAVRKKAEEKTEAWARFTALLEGARPDCLELY
jgi:hypothetical protein